MGDPNCTFYDEAIPYDAVIPYDGICAQPQPVTNRPIYWVGKRSSWEKDKEDKKRKQRRLVVAITSEIFSVNDTQYRKNEPNRIRVAEDLDPVDIAVSKLMADSTQPHIDVRSRIEDNTQLVPVVETNIEDIAKLNSGGLPVVEAEEPDDLFGDIEEVYVDSRVFDEDNNIAVVCEVVTNEKDDVIIKVETDDDRDNKHK